MCLGWETALRAALASFSIWRGFRPSRSASVALPGWGLRTLSHQTSQSCVGMASCAGVSPNRRCAHLARDSIQNAAARITGSIGGNPVSSSKMDSPSGGEGAPSETV